MSESNYSINDLKHFVKEAEQAARGADKEHGGYSKKAHTILNEIKNSCNKDIQIRKDNQKIKDVNHKTIDDGLQQVKKIKKLEGLDISLNRNRLNFINNIIDDMYKAGNKDDIKNYINVISDELVGKTGAEFRRNILKIILELNRKQAKLPNKQINYPSLVKSTVNFIKETYNNSIKSTKSTQKTTDNSGVVNNNTNDSVNMTHLVNSNSNSDTNYNSDSVNVDYLADVGNNVKYVKLRYKAIQESKSIIKSLSQDSRGGGTINLIKTSGLLVLLTSFNLMLNNYIAHKQHHSKITFIDYLDDKRIVIPLFNSKFDDNAIEWIYNLNNYFIKNKPETFRFTWLDSELLCPILDIMYNLLYKYVNDFAGSHESFLIVVLFEAFLSLNDNGSGYIIP